VKSNNRGKNNKLKDKEKVSQMEKSVSAQKDGFRYDYNDSSDFNDDKMS
jgi:hypothetical protein